MGIWKTLVLIALAAAVGAFGGYAFIKDRSYASGYEAGKAEESQRSVSQMVASLSEKDKLRADYDALVADYNTLLDEAKGYYAAAQYNYRKPINCTSSSYGISNQFRSTSCY